MSNNQLPADTVERIKADATKAFPIPVKFSDQVACMERRYGYIAGATEMAERVQKLIDLLDDASYYVEHHLTSDDHKAMAEAKELSTKIDEVLQQWKEGKEVGQAEAKEGLIRLILAGAAEASKDGESAKEYLAKEGVDVKKVMEDGRYIQWKAELIKLVSDATGESKVLISDTEARKWYDDGATPYQTFRETWNME